MEIFLTLLAVGALFAIVKYSVSAAVAIAGLLAFGTIGYWGLIALACILLFFFIDHDNGFGATATLVGFFLIHQLFGDMKLFSYVAIHPMSAVKWLAFYFAAGTLWSIAKWWFHVHAEREKYDDEMASYINGRLRYVKIDEAKKDWLKHCSIEKPSASKSKEKIIRWMTFWPWSMVWTLINDPIKKLFKSIYRRIEGLLQKISDNAWAGVEEDSEKN